MLEIVQGLSQEMRLHQLVIDAFVPDQYQQLIHSHATWNEDTGEWHLVSPASLGTVPALTDILPWPAERHRLRW